MLTQVACDKNTGLRITTHRIYFEAVKVLVNFAFTGRELKRIIAHSLDDRVASI